MDNILRVTNHLRMKLTQNGCPDVTRHSLCVVITRDGQKCYRDSRGNWWRMYLFVEGAETYDKIESVRQAFEAARAYAKFQKLLADLPAPRLHETIPNFHNTPMRLERLLEAIQVDSCNRAKEVRSEIEFVERRIGMCGRLLDRHAKGEIPERITHNDTKINNVMLDEKTWEGVCVVDLDTVMPGLALYDFGDMVRSGTAAAAEDEQDLSKVRMRLDMFEALANGYLAEADFLTPAEREELVFSGRLITLMIGMRFLTDYLQGDTYFKIKRPNHNLDRCRGQFKMVESMEEQEDQMEKIVSGSVAS
jgi:Ser/Thr protein kinase RdoA (MazF antagonist)